MGEIVDALLEKLSDESADTRSLTRFIKAPDFRCGGKLKCNFDFLEVYGRGFGTFLHQSEFLIDTATNDFNLRFFVIDSASAFQSLKSAMLLGTIDGISNATHTDFTVLVTCAARDAEKLAKLVSKLPHFRTEIKLSHYFLIEDRFSRSRFLSLHEALEYFIEQRLGYLIGRYKWTRTQAKQFYSEELQSVKNDYSSPRRTLVELAT